MFGGGGGTGCEYLSETLPNGLVISLETSETTCLDDGIPQLAVLGDKLFVDILNSVEDPSTEQITLLFPDGRALEFGDKNSYDRRSYHTQWNDPLGEYKFVFQANGLIAERTISIVAPDEPTVFPTDNGILLYGFQPEEHIRLLRYASTGWVAELYRRFEYASELQVDEQGQLFVQSSNVTLGTNYEQPHHYLVIGDKSGLVSNALYQEAPLSTVSYLPDEVIAEARLSPDPAAPVVQHLNSNNIVGLTNFYFDLTQQTIWVEVSILGLMDRRNRTSGWLPSELIVPEHLDLGIVKTVRDTSIRSGPGVTYPLLSEVSEETELPLLAFSQFDQHSSMRWVPVSFSNKLAWVAESDVIRWGPPLIRNVSIANSWEPCDTPVLRSNFPEGTTEIYAEWEYDNIPVGAEYVRVWSMEGEEWVRYQCAWPGPEWGYSRVRLYESGGLRSGKWELKIFINGEELLHESITVEGDHQYWVPAGVENRCFDE